MPEQFADVAPLTRTLEQLDTAWKPSKGYPAKMILAGEMLTTPTLDGNRKWLEKHFLELGVFKDQAKDFALRAGIKEPKLLDALATGAPPVAPDLKEAKKVARVAKKAAKLAMQDWYQEAGGPEGTEALRASAAASVVARDTAKAVAEMEHKARKTARKTKIKAVPAVPDEVSEVTERPLDQLCREVVKREESGRDLDERGGRNFQQAEDHYIAAGILLAQIKERTKGGKAWVAAYTKQCHLKKDRVNVLMRLGDGRTSLLQVRAEGAKRAAKHIEHLKAAAAPERLLVTSQDQLLRQAKKLVAEMVPETWQELVNYQATLGGAA